jgi:CheY-like chemotaxis protein
MTAPLGVVVDDDRHVRSFFAKVLLTSAATTQGDEAIAAGCDVVLEKPCSPALLVTTIQRLLVKLRLTRAH